MFGFILLTMLLIIGCGSNDNNSSGDSASSNSGSSNSGTDTSTETVEEGEVVTISFIHWRGEDVETWDEVIANFEAENPLIKVETNVFTSGDYQSSAQQQLIDGQAGDVFPVFPGGQYTAIQEAGLLMDLTDESVVENYEASLLGAGQTDGRQYALPYHLVFNQPLYNVGMFEELGIEYPTDWDSFLAAGETLKENGIIPIAFAGGGPHPRQLMNTMMMNEAPDEDIWEKVMNGEEKITNDWWVNTLSKFKELDDREFFQPNALGAGDEPTRILFNTEQAAMLASGSYHIAGTMAENPDMKIGMLPPITVAEEDIVWEGIHTTTFMLGINERSSKKEQAMIFLEYLSDPVNSSFYANKTGQMAVIKDVEFTSESLAIIEPWVQRNTRFQPRFLITDLEIEDAVVNSIQAVLSGDSPQKAAEDAQNIIDQVLSR